MQIVREGMEWKKLHLLGKGSYGSVYLAGKMNGNSYWMSMDYSSMVAVKSACSKRSTSLQDEANLLQEVRGCPYIIQGLGTDVSLEQGRRVYNLILEYACFGSLDKIIKNYEGSMSESLVATYTEMLVRGLATLHEKEIVHCDFKPANILVFPSPGLKGTGHELLKIADLGLSKKEWECDRKGHCTPLYASPELVLCDLQEKTGDIWALGCTVAEMITGQPIWDCNCSEVELFCHIAYGSPRIPQNISQDAKDFLERCLDTDHNRRWTAAMLLNHPFVVKNSMLMSSAAAERHQEEVIISERQRPWFSRKGMFSTPRKAESEAVDNYKPYQLFPKQGCGLLFSLPPSIVSWRIC